MDKALVLGLTIFILSEVLCVVALFSSDWLVSDHVGNTRLGLTVLCHGAPEKETLCTFALPHAAWLGCALLMCVAVTLTGATICFLVVALHKKRKAFEEAAKWTGLGGTMFMCLVGIIFPLGFSKLELGGEPFLLPGTFSTGYSYALFNLAIVSNIVALLAVHRFFACRLLRNRT